MNRSAIGIRGICYDAGSSFQRGPALGPEEIRKELNSGSMNLTSENGADLNEWPSCDRGDFAIESYFDIEALTLRHLKTCDRLFTLGGDHSITYPILKAYHKKYPFLDVLQIDAHPDLYQSYEGDPYSHACPFARIMEDGLATHLVQVGIRTLNPHQQDQSRRFGTEMYTMQKGLPKAPLKFENPVYISLDLDALDPAFAPGVSHREPGGLATREVIHLLQQLQGRVVGADLVEYNPSRDVDRLTANLGAKLMKELLGRLV